MHIRKVLIDLNDKGFVSEIEIWKIKSKKRKD
jgi:uncharacterized protein YuzE